MKSSVRTLLLLLCLLLALAGAARADAPKELVDSAGHTVTIEQIPATLVSLSPSNTEIVFALGAGDKLVGVDAYSNYPPEALAIQNKVGDFTGPNVESIVALQPDLVLADNTLQAEAIERMEAFGIPVLCVNATAYDEIAVTIQLVADALSVDAKPLLEEMSARRAAVEIAAQGASPVRAYFALAFGEYGDWSAGTGTFIDEMIQMAGGENVAASSGFEWPQYTLEQLFVEDPDVILVSGDEAAKQAFCTAEQYADLRAVREGRVYAIDADTSSRPAPRITQALEAIALALHPELSAQ